MSAEDNPVAWGWRLFDMTAADWLLGLSDDEGIVAGRDRVALMWLRQRPAGSDLRAARTRPRHDPDLHLRRLPRAGHRVPAPR